MAVTRGPLVLAAREGSKKTLLRAVVPEPVIPPAVVRLPVEVVPAVEILPAAVNRPVVVNLPAAVGWHLVAAD